MLAHVNGNDEGVRPARPHTGLTADGKRLREIVTYARRGSRFSARQHAAWEQYGDAYVVPDEAVDEEEVDVAAWFGRRAPLVVEIGSGVGEATVPLAAARPSCDVLALEVWRPGVAETLHRLGRAGVTNVRLISVDAVWSMRNLLGEGAVHELWTFFPDPWPKKRHHRRRLVNAEFAAVAASRLEPGGLWRLATDWADYAEQMVEVLDAEPLLENVHAGPAPRWDERPVTRFERRGRDAGRQITDLTYRRV
jgi:tRNA (guanine-N7-)-methyltransferase